ncbi:MAG: TonB-dependent receptor [Porticoccaceae bacterium]|nr:TonB-dependent receptor [Porticoccaceae bacterium]
MAGLTQAEPLQEVIVTAGFREMPVDTFPASLTVVGPDAIAGRAAQHLEEVLNLAPNVNFSSGASRGRYIQIRGIGERSQFVDPINPSVGLTVDDINFSGVGNAGTLFDVEQVEVLRGPQGTRFGAYGLAGMVNITSQAPTDTFEGLITGGAGNHGHRELGAVLSGPLTENVLGRLAVQRHSSDGFINNVYLDRDTGERDELTARGKLRWLVSDDLVVDSTLFYANVDNGFDHFSLDNNRKTLSDEPGRDLQESLALGLTATWTGAEAFTIKSTVALEDTRLEYSFDEDWTNTAICDGLACDSADWGFDWWYSSTDSYRRQRDGAQLDVRLVSSEEGRLFDAIDWVAGLYYYDKREKLRRDFFDWDLGAQSSMNSRYDTRQIALYGELSAPLGDKMTFTLGGRAEDFVGKYRDSRAIRARPDETLWGGEARLEYQFDESTLIYGLVSRGFKAGGVNGEALATAQKNNFDDSVIAFLSDRLEFETETAINYEIGFKGNYLDDRLQLRAAVFHMDRDDIQLRGWYNEGPLFVGYIDNGSSGRNRGVEVEAQLVVIPALELFVSAGYLDTKISDFVVEGDDGLIDKSGRDQAHAPNYQYNAGAHWTIIDNLRARVEVEGKDSFYFSDSHDAKSSTYNLVHASLTWQVDRMELRLWGRNLTDKDYATRGFYFANDPRDFFESEQAYVQLGDPRTYGLTVTYQF